MNRQNRARILDVPERRALAAPLGVRDGAGEIQLEGYASTYEAYDCYGGTENGGWVEQLDRRAFDTTLKTKPDVQLLINHEGLPLARTTSGTLHLSADSKGLKVRASLDPEDSDVKNLVPKMRRGDVNEMSFGFRVKDQKWNKDYSHRIITEVSLHKGDVSVVSYGMNPTTSAQLSDAVGMIAQLSNKQMAELRNLDSAVLRRALDHLASVSGTGGVSLEVDGDHLIVRTADGREFAVPVATSSATRGVGAISGGATVRVPGMGVSQRKADMADKAPDEEEKGAPPFVEDDEEEDKPEDRAAAPDEEPDADEEGGPSDEDEDDEEVVQDSARRTLEELAPPRGHMSIEDARRLLRGGEESLDLSRARAVFDS